MKTFFFSVLTLTALSAYASGEQKPPYPLTTCVVSGEPLDSMGPAHVITYQGQEVRFCCENCQPKFEKNPAPFLQKIKDAAK